MAHIVKFPVPDELNRFFKESRTRLTVLIQALNLSSEKGVLDERQYRALLIYTGINPARDLCYFDQVILQYHIDNYYGLDIQI